MFNLALILVLYGDPEIERALKDERATNSERVELKKICIRESQCLEGASKHPSDGKHGKRMYDAGFRVHWIPELCEEFYDGIPYDEWAPRGLYGMSPAYHLRRVGDVTEWEDCPHPSWLDDPYVATVAAIRFYRSCKNCTCTDRLERWAGKGTWAKRTLWHKVSRIRKTCGLWAAVKYAIFG